MKLISVSSLLYYVSDLEKSKSFYEAAGFNFDKSTDSRVVTYLNWFSIELRKAEGPVSSNSGEYVYVKVDSVDELKARLESKGHETGEPESAGAGVTELQVSDPDGYKLMFFQKK